MARAVSPGYSYHITQRGADQKAIFREDRDRYIYLSLLKESGEKHGLSYEGYCLMTNHVHLLAVPREANSLHLGLKWAHAAYARYYHASYGGCGHFWQARFYSCILSGPHRWRALAYVEMNPVRAGMRARAEDYVWSSASAHLGLGRPHLPLDMEDFRTDWDAVTWSGQLRRMETDYDFWKGLRTATQTGRPLVPEETLMRLEAELGRSLRPMKRGPKARVAAAGFGPAMVQNRLEFGD